jgi:hypothetical protein
MEGSTLTDDSSAYRGPSTAVRCFASEKHLTPLRMTPREGLCRSAKGLGRLPSCQARAGSVRIGLWSSGRCCRGVQERAGAGLQGAIAVVLGIARSQYDDRDRGQLGVLLQAIENHETIPGGQADVENDQVGALFVGHGDRGKSVGCVEG